VLSRPPAFILSQDQTLHFEESVVFGSKTCFSKFWNSLLNLEVCVKLLH
jgi:hypothetical protein